MRAVTLGELLAEGDPQEHLDEAAATRLAELLRARNQRTVGDEPRRVVDALDQHVDWLERHAGERWPVIRRGERAPIPAPLRLSIYLRDDRTCRGSYWPTHSDKLELDHLIPWSAGGPDDSDNLRTICSWCNTKRSNFIDYAHGRNYVPTTWWCAECWTPDSPPRHRWRDGTEPNRAPRIYPEDTGIELVFCAHCSEFSYSPHYFVGVAGRRLLDLIAPPQLPAARGVTA